MAASRKSPACRLNEQSARDPAAARVRIDVERLVWDLEYRDEVRVYLKSEANP